jgi:PAS domain S-box-containing protein/putative nucleotidyltransferase with HDIG domain
MDPRTVRMTSDATEASSDPARDAVERACAESVPAAARSDPDAGPERMDERPDILIAAPDARLSQSLEDALRASGLGFSVRRADTMAAFTDALDARPPDLVLATWKLVDFDGLAVLSLVQERRAAIPVIIVADALDGMSVSEIAKAGARDVITRNGFDRIAFSVHRALAERGERRKRRQFEEELEARAAMVAAEHDVAPDGILLVDRRGDVVSVNQRFVDMWEIPAEVAATRSSRGTLEAMLRKLGDPDGHAKRIRDLHRHQTASVHEEIALKDGRVFDCYSAPLLRDGHHGEYLGRAWFYRDVTAHRDVRNRAHEDGELLRALVEQDVVGTLVFRTDGGIAYVNPKFASVLGYAAEEVLGRDFMDFVEKSSREDALAKFRAVVSGERHSVQVQSKVLAKTGGVVDILGQFTATTYEGRPAVAGIALDVTALKRTELALEANEQLYRAVVSAMTEGVLVIDGDGRILTANASAARILGLPPERIVGRKAFDPAWELVGDDGGRLPPEARPSAIAFRTGQGQRDALIGLKRDGGEPIWLATNAEPLFGKDEMRPHAVVVSFSDITPHKLAQDALTRVNHALKVLIQANEVLVRTTSEQELLDEMCRALVETGGYALVWIGFPEEQPAMVVRSVARGGNGGVEPTDADRNALLDHSAAAQAVLRSGEPSVSQDLAADGPDAAKAGDGIVPAAGARIALPLLDGKTTFGVLTLYAAGAGAFTPDAVSLLVQLAEDLSYGILALRERVKREESEKGLRRSMEAAVQAMASTLEMRDPYTAGHQRGVARLAIAIARDVGVPEDEVKGIYLAAIVHDIGKIRIPVDILNKPGPLTQLEYELIQTHAQVGYDIVKNVDFPWPVAEMVLQHHERLDGSGYPAGLKGDEILPGARILAVADVVQAMSMRRPYRGSYGEAAALAEIERGRGRLYDPAAVDACLKLFREKGFAFE